MKTKILKTLGLVLFGIGLVSLGLTSDNIWAQLACTASSLIICFIGGKVAMASGAIDINEEA